MRKKIYRQIISFLLIIALLLTLTPGNLFLAQAASTPAWTHMSDAEAAAGYAAYTEATDTITFNATGDFSGRMKYVGIDDVSGKDYAIEFDMTVDGGALGV